MRSPEESGDAIEFPISENPGMRVSRVEKILSPDSSRQKVKYLPTPPDFVAGAASLDSS